jgi:cysteine dioxygenase
LSFNIEVFILSWKSGYETLPHDHSKNGCWLKVLRGKLNETLYTGELEMINNRDVSEGQYSFMSNDIGYHSIRNDDESISFSIHIYSPPMHKTIYFSK